VIVILDDEPEMRKALHRLLTGRGFPVEEYECGGILAGSGIPVMLASKQQSAIR
jgi:FixJ family two-component response regulator